MRTMLKESLGRLGAQSVRLVAFLFAIGAISSAWAATPLAVWNGDFGVATTRNGVTFDANGNTVAQDGSYVEIGSSSAVGVKFSTSTAYNYLQVVFTVSDLDEDAASDRALVQTYSGTSSEGGVYLKDGTIDTSGINGDAKWSSTNPVSDGALTSYSEDESTERTYAVECAHSSSTAWGLHLYELGSGARSVVFGSSSSIGLRYGTTYDCVTIGGKLSSSSNFAAMPGLKIKKVAIYVSDSSFPLDNSAMTGYIFPESSVVASGASTSISALNTSAPVWTLIQSGATVTVDAEPANDVMFIGDAFSMSGTTVTVADGVTLDLENTTLAALTLDFGTERTLPTISNVGDVPVTVILDEVSGDNGSIAITGGSDAYTYKVVRTDGRTAAATYDNGTVTYKNYEAGVSSITLTADANLSDLCGETDFGAATSTLTVANDGDYVLTVDEDMANASITFTGSGTTTLAIANGVSFTAPATFANSGTGSVIVRVDAGGTCEINGKQTFLTVPAKFVLNGGSLVNNGADIGIGYNQISTLELTADSYVGGTCTFGLVGSQYAATTLTLNGYTLTMNITGGNKLFLLNSVESDDGTIRVKQGVFACYYQSGSARQNRLNCTVVLDNDYYQQDGTTYSGANSGYCEFFIANNGSQPTVKNIYATNGKGGMISGYSETRILTVTGTLGLPFKETITPKLALADGATLKALTSDGAACPVYGFSIAESATIYVDVSDIILSQTTPIFTWTSETKPNGTFVFKDVDLRTTYELVKGDTGLTINQYVARATVGDVVTPYYSLTDAIQNADDDTEIDVFVTSSENAVTVAKDATIALGENDVTINTLTVSEDAKLTLTGSGTFTIGALAGEGTLSIDAQDTVALSIPVGTTFGSFACNTKLTVTGAIAKNTTLFTIGSGSYANERVATSDYGDVHYTATDGAYVVGKTYYWIGTGTGTGNSNHIETDKTGNWSLSEGGSSASDLPLTFDTAIFYNSGKYVQMANDLPFDFVINADTTFEARATSPKLGNFADSTLTVADGVTMSIGASGSGSSAPSVSIYNKVIGSESARITPYTSANNRSILFYGDTSEFKGVVDITIGNDSGFVSIKSAKAANNEYAHWYISTNGTAATKSNAKDRTPFGVDNQEYKFGVLKAYIKSSTNGKWNSSNYKVTLTVGEKIDEDSWLRGSWSTYDNAKHNDYGGTIQWKAPTATFTQAAKNAYNVTLMGGGDVYVEASSTENAAAEFVPTQLNFTDNGGYLTIDDDNAAIAGDIVAAINTKTAAVGFNVTAADTVTVAASNLANADLAKKGAGTISLTGVTAVGTVTVTEGSLILPTGTTYTLGWGTVQDTTYTDGIKLVLGDAVVSDGKGFLRVSDALTYAYMQNNSSLTVAVNDATWEDDGTYAEFFVWDSEKRIYTQVRMAARVLASKYGTIAAAIDALTADNQTVVLLDNVNEEVVYDKAYAVTFDLAGYTWSFDDDPDNNHYAAFKNNGGTATFKDSSELGTGKIDGGSGFCVWARTGSIVIESGTYENDSNDNYAVYVGTTDANLPGDAPTATITGGTFVNKNTEEYLYKAGWKSVNLNVMNYNDGSANPSKAATKMATTLIQVSGGTFTWDLALGDDNMGGTFVAAGYYSYESSEGVWTVAQCVAKRHGTTTYYNTLANAIADVGETEGAVVELCASTDEDFEIGAGKRLQLLAASGLEITGTMTLSGGTFAFDPNYAGSFGCDVVATAGTDSKIYYQANSATFGWGGALSGSGNVEFEMPYANKGMRIGGDYTGFTGTLTWNCAGYTTAVGFTGSGTTTFGAGSKLVVKTPSDTKVNAFELARHLTVGAVDFQPNANVATKNVTLTLTGSEDGSTFNGPTSGYTFTVNKNGDDTLTIGSGFSTEQDIRFNINGGNLAVNAADYSTGIDMKTVTVNFASGSGIVAPKTALSTVVLFTAKTITGVENLSLDDWTITAVGGGENDTEYYSLTLTREGVYAEDGVGNIFSLPDSWDDGLPEGTQPFDVVTGKTITYGQAYALGLIDAGGDVSDLATPTIAVDGATVTVTLADEDALANYTITCYLQAKDDLAVAWPTLDIADNTTYVATAALGAAMNYTKGTGETKKFYRVVVGIADKSGE